MLDEEFMLSSFYGYSCTPVPKKRGVKVKVRKRKVDPNDPRTWCSFTARVPYKVFMWLISDRSRTVGSKALIKAYLRAHPDESEETLYG